MTLKFHKQVKYQMLNKGHLEMVKKKSAMSIGG